MFETLGIAVVARDPATLEAALGREGRSATRSSRSSPSSCCTRSRPSRRSPSRNFDDDADFTWGLRATARRRRHRDRRGHPHRRPRHRHGPRRIPDFAGRVDHDAARSSPARRAQDGHGHGTHTHGHRVPARPIPPSGRRYGVAADAEIFVGKVLSNAGSGTDAGILAGIDWAITNGVPDHLDVARRRHPPGVAHLRGGRPARARRGHADRRRRRQQRQPQHRASSASSASRRTARRSWRSPPSTRELADRRLLRGRDLRRGRRDRHRRPGRRRLLVVADAAPHEHDLRHEHGDAARRRDRGAVGAGRPARAGRRCGTPSCDAAEKLDLPATDAGAGLVQAPPPASSPARADIVRRRCVS